MAFISRFERTSLQSSAVEWNGACGWRQIAHSQLHLADDGEGLELGYGLGYALIQVARFRRGRGSGAILYASHGQHLRDQFFNTCGVGESTLVARLVLLW